MGQENMSEQPTPVPDSHTTAIKIYPNPSTNFFVIQTTATVRKVEIYTILGKKLKEYIQPDPNEHFDVADLDRGMYLVSILDTENKVIKTVRLSKQ